MEDPDQELVDGLLQRRDGAVEAFVARFKPRIDAAAAGMGVPYADRADLTQLTLIACLDSVTAFRRDSRLSTWVAGVVKNKVLTYRRDSRRPGRSATSLEGLPPNSLGSLVAADGQEARLVAQEALQRLPPRHAVALWLHYRQGKSVDDLMAMLSLSRSRVHAILQEARDQLTHEVLTRNQRPPGRLKE
jgi:RNA polymerase sigma factor (sigma-70 family)